MGDPLSCGGDLAAALAVGQQFCSKDELGSTVRRHCHALGRKPRVQASDSYRLYHTCATVPKRPKPPRDGDPPRCPYRVFGRRGRTTDKLWAWKITASCLEHTCAQQACQRASRHASAIKASDIRDIAAATVEAQTSSHGNVASWIIQEGRRRGLAVGPAMAYFARRQAMSTTQTATESFRRIERTLAALRAADAHTVAEVEVEG